MKASPTIFTLLFFGCALQLFGQNPLEGTWERQTDSLWSTKIITPTHWMVFKEDITGGTKKFQRAHGGTYTRDGKNYIERINMASWEVIGTEVTGFTFKVDGDTFHQEGTFIMGDGSVVPIDEVWKKVTTVKANPNNPAIGTWYRVSSVVTKEDGTMESTTNATATCFELITPTHWIRLSHRESQFENIMGGSYTAEGNMVYPKTEFASFPIHNNEKMEITHKVTFDKRYSTGIVTGPDGKKISSFEEVFQRVSKKHQLAK